MRRIHLALAVAVLSTAACMTPRPKLATNVPPDPASGYVGALFAKDTIIRFGFILQDEAGKHEYTLSLDRGVGLVDLPPGRYHVTGWVTAALSGEIFTKQDLPAENALARPFELAGGQIVLLGKWQGESHASWGKRHFAIAPQVITVDDAAAAVREIYPLFRDAPVSCWLCTE